MAAATVISMGFCRKVTTTATMSGASAFIQTGAPDPAVLFLHATRSRAGELPVAKPATRKMKQVASLLHPVARFVHAVADGTGVVTEQTGHSLQGSFRVQTIRRPSAEGDGKPL